MSKHKEDFISIVDGCDCCKEQQWNKVFNSLSNIVSLNKEVISYV